MNMKDEYSLLHLLPYLARYRAKMAVGFAMVLLTVATSMLEIGRAHV